MTLYINYQTPGVYVLPSWLFLIAFERALTKNHCNLATTFIISILSDTFIKIVKQLLLKMYIFLYKQY